MSTIFRVVFLVIARLNFGLLVTHPAYNDEGQYTAPVLLFAFVIGMQCCVLFLCNTFEKILTIHWIISPSFDSFISDRSRRFHHVGVDVITIWDDVVNCTVFSFVGLGEDPQVLAIRAPALFEVSLNFSFVVPHTHTPIFSDDPSKLSTSRSRRTLIGDSSVLLPALFYVAAYFDLSVMHFTYHMLSYLATTIFFVRVYISLHSKASSAAYVGNINTIVTMCLRP